MNITDEQAKLFGEILWDRLASTEPSQWTDYESVVTTFCEIAPLRMLQDAINDIRDEVGRNIVSKEIARKMF